VTKPLASWVGGGVCDAIVAVIRDVTDTASPRFAVELT
jgi:hypothetical protein